MTDPLWSWKDLIAATRGRPEGTAAGGVTGISIDTRTLAPGDLFVALRGDTQDGHAYVAKAFEKGAAAALVSEDFVTPAGAGPLIRVGDPDRDPALAALERLGVAARKRLAPEARVIAVTGSVGKTSTKEMLKLCLTSVDPHTHASDKSYNNHWGVPLTLARMPKDTKYGVFEIGMNHAGEIRPLTKMVRPHVAIVTTVGPVHLEFFGSEAAIADAKAEIFEGLEPQGVAVLKIDNRQYERLKRAALKTNASIVSFGKQGDAVADYTLVKAGDIAGMGTMVTAMQGDNSLEYVVGTHGEHQAFNSLTVVAALQSIGIALETFAQELEFCRAAEGRGKELIYQLQGGRVMLVDESYNANPLSMAAALRTLSEIFFMPNWPDVTDTRRIAVLGDMRELGPTSRQMHAALLQPVRDSHIDLVFACGPHMAALYDALPQDKRGHYDLRSEGLIQPLLKEIRPGDVIMIKGSLGTRMAPIVEALKAHLTAMAGTQ